MAKQESLFKILSRQPWWVSVAVAALLFGIAQLALPVMIAGAIAAPFLAISFYAGYRQLRSPSAANVGAMLDRIRTMPWEKFSSAILEAYRREGYTVSEIYRDPVDLKLEKGARVAIVSCKRWKAAQTGIGPLRDLAGAREAYAASECIYVAAGDFTANARDYAKRESIRLVSDAELAKLIARGG